MRLLVFSERMRAPYDEGIKNVAVHLIEALAASHDVLALTSDGQGNVEYGIANINVNRLLLDARLQATIRRFRPQAIVYVPTACATVFSMLRARVLRWHGRGAPTALVALQPRHYGPLGRGLVGRLAPEWVLAQSARTGLALERLGCRTFLLPPAVDPWRYQPTTPEDKVALRSKYGVPSDAIVVTHVGHLKGKRNLARLLELQAKVGYHAVIVASTSTERDAMLTAALHDAGVTLLDWYVPNVEEIYGLSDVYLFLAVEETAAIEVPLSVLEAMACNLRVICTPFGGLPDFFEPGGGLFYWNGQEKLPDLVELALSTPCATRTMVENRTWSAASESLVQVLMSGVV
jgi:glycosyltransferase involved in cell wall biosynthesis